MKVNCPQCKKIVIWSPDSTYRPFCSKQCQLIDLGQWADEEHKISNTPNSDELVPSNVSLAKHDLSPEDVENIEELLNNLNKNNPYHS